jgi:hexokinase
LFYGLKVSPNKIFKMKENIFKLSTAQLKEIATDLQHKVEYGLNNDNTEIQCIPTYIKPKTLGVEGQATVLDLGGTNYRASVVSFKDGATDIYPADGWSKDLSVMKTKGFTARDLFAEQASFLKDLKVPEKSPIGYCFSYPAECLPDGDAKLLRWTKGVDIPEMIDQPIGKPLKDYLNEQGVAEFTAVKVINDTVASLFAGLSDSSFDAYIGLIVGTGTNMATFIHSDRIGKLDKELNWQGLTPINLESGNYRPLHLTAVDDQVDVASGTEGAQRFEKAVSGMYLGKIFTTLFPKDGFDEKFDAKSLTDLINKPDKNKKRHVRAASRIYKRSAKLVAASLAGLVAVMVAHDPAIKKICLTAEGSLFWSKVKGCKAYNKQVSKYLKTLLDAMGHKDVRVKVKEIKNANLIGSAVAALS